MSGPLPPLPLTSQCHYLRHNVVTSEKGANETYIYIHTKLITYTFIATVSECLQEIMPLIVGYITASIVHVCITEMVTT